MLFKDEKIALSVKGISKTFQKHKNKTIKAVDNVSFEIFRGEVFGVLGPNGSGKSTLIRMISTLLIPDTGNILVFGFDAEKEANSVRNLVNRVSVEASFFKKLSAMENLLFTAGLYGISKAKAREELLRIFDRIGLSRKRIHDPLEDFSRGMQQKVAIARAFLTSPNLLLLDEPTTGLDPRAKKEVQALIQEVCKEHDTSILLTTHDMFEAEELCGRVAIFHEGKVQKMGEVMKLKAAIPGGPLVSLEDVFMHYTGTTLKEADSGFEEAETLQEVS
ncbi:MAG TPA: ABC transporter ATP-binding protein [Thermotogota bacterium]|nr:ABC transporter ATP-binding protein [Thermotogota bacterium]HRW92468.1 ABC transporter ATP-binding protein [Thermotogota bacterium]